MAPEPLYLDECVHARIAVLLRKDGFDVLTVQEAGMLGASDEAHLEFATDQRRVLVTFDVADFSTLTRSWAEQGREHAGVILCAQRGAEVVIEWLKAALEAYAEQSLAHNVIWLPVK